MTLKILVAALSTIFISCSQQSTGAEDVYIVPTRQEPMVDTNSNTPPAPPPIQVYYLPSNFIIDTAGQVYFYQQQQYGPFCGTGIDWEIPEFIGLKPKDIIRVPINGIADFLKMNLLNLDKNDRRVAIASLKDTIQSEGLSKLFKVFKDPSNNIRWTFRKATDEERIVFKFKQQNQEYYYKDIKWDSTKIRFPFVTLPKLEEE